MKIYVFVLLMICSCFADIPFRIKQEKVNTVGNHLEIGFEGNTNNLKLSVYKIANENNFLASQNNFHKLQIEDSNIRPKLNHAISTSSLTTKPKIHGKSIENSQFSLVAYVQNPKLQETRGDGYKKLFFPSIKNAGLYLVECRRDNYIAYSLAAITNLAIITRRDQQQLIVYSVNRSTGQLFANSNVSVYRNNKLVETRTSNHKGIAHFNIHYSPQLLVTAKVQNNFTIDDAMFFPSIVDVQKCYIFTERPLYLPGEKVYFKGIMRSQRGGEYFLSKTNFTVNYTIKDAQDNKVASGKTTAISGIFSGEIDLPKEMSLGTCFLECKGLNKVFQTEFQVEKFQKPKFKVRIVGDEKAILMGQKANFKVNCNYYSGGEITKGRVNYELYKSAFHQPLFEEVGLDQFYSKNEFRSFKPQLVKTGSVDLKDGGLSLSFPTDKDQFSYNYRLQVSVRDEARNSASGSGSIKVERYPTKLDMKTSKQLYALEEQIIVTVKAVDINSKPIITPFRIKAIRRERLSLQGGNTETVEKLQEKIFFTSEGKTDKDGKAIIEIPAALNGAIDIEIEAIGSEGQISKTVWVSEGDAPLSYSGDSILLVADKKTYRVNETAHILVVLPTKKISPLLTVEGVDLLEYTVVNISKNSYVFKLVITEQMSPNIYFKAAAIYRNGFMESKHMIVVPPQHKILDVKVKIDKSNYRPGEKATFDITTIDHKGKPVTTDFSIGVVDQSIYSLASDRNALLHQFFYPLRRENVNSGSSIRLLSYDYAKLSSRLPAPVIKKLFSNLKKKMSAVRSDSQRRPSENTMDEEADDMADAVSDESEGALFEDSDESEAPAPASEPVPQASAPRGRSAEKKESPKKQQNAEKQNARKLFKTTATWVASTTTDQNGHAQISFDFPDNLTDWRVVVRAVDGSTRVGYLEQEVSTRKPLMVSLTRPRFLVEGDKGTTSIRARNATKTKQELLLGLQSSKHIEFSKISSEKKVVKVGKWLNQNISFVAKNSGIAKINSSVTAKQYSDSKNEEIRILPHGILKSYGYSGRLLQKSQHKFTLPENTTQSKVTVRILPGFLAAIQESTHMLLEYPYGCAEQTMSRFMPNIVASEIMQKMQMEIDTATLQKNVNAGVNRLIQLQNKDGGWGWWNSNEASHPMLSAYVALGLIHAKNLDYEINVQVLERALVFLKSSLKNSAVNYATKAYTAYALSCAKNLPQGALDAIFDQEERLKADSYTLSLLTLSFVQQNRSAEAKILAKEVAEKSQFSGDSFPYWGDTNAVSWNKNAIEVTAMAIRALVASDSKNKLIVPALEWLMSKRKDRGWNSTKDTSEVVLTLCSYLNAHGVQKGTSTKVTISANGKSHVVDVSSSGVTQVFSSLQPTTTLDIHSDNNSAYLYYTAHIEYFTAEKNISETTSGMAVKRSYFTLHKDETQQNYTRKPLGKDISPDDMIMVELEIDCSQSREFVMLEDHVPASAIVITKDRLLQMNSSVESQYTHREFHDAKTIFFFTNLKQGKHKVYYFFRPSIAGTFHALPAIASLMYYPEIRGNSTEKIFTIK
ncbi:alpha-2-macroglobulin [Candidatus Uabimicrobium sp. HlEnr_7]|uniref:alpha-2-macroglobulin family protein n=1 Tax=Candidatus Uabimicrobium helgolandensis TaxID=3095367 RepID=UPI003556DB4A